MMGCYSDSLIGIISPSVLGKIICIDDMKLFGRNYLMSVTGNNIYLLNENTFEDDSTCLPIRKQYMLEMISYFVTS